MAAKAKVAHQRFVLQHPDQVLATPTSIEAVVTIVTNLECKTAAYSGHASGRGVPGIIQLGNAPSSPSPAKVKRRMAVLLVCQTANFIASRAGRDDARLVISGVSSGAP